MSTTKTTDKEQEVASNRVTHGFEINNDPFNETLRPNPTLESNYGTGAFPSKTTLDLTDYNYKLRGTLGDVLDFLQNNQQSTLSTRNGEYVSIAIREGLVASRQTTRIIAPSVVPGHTSESVAVNYGNTKAEEDPEKGIKKRSEKTEKEKEKDKQKAVRIDGKAQTGEIFDQKLENAKQRRENLAPLQKLPIIGKSLYQMATKAPGKLVEVEIGTNIHKRTNASDILIDLRKPNGTIEEVVDKIRGAYNLHQSHESKVKHGFEINTTLYEQEQLRANPSLERNLTRREAKRANVQLDVTSQGYRMQGRLGAVLDFLQRNKGAVFTNRTGDDLQIAIAQTTKMQLSTPKDVYLGAVKSELEKFISWYLRYGAMGSAMKGASSLAGIQTGSETLKFESPQKSKEFIAGVVDALKDLGDRFQAIDRALYINDTKKLIQSYLNLKEPIVNKIIEGIHNKSIKGISEKDRTELGKVNERKRDNWKKFEQRIENVSKRRIGLKPLQSIPLLGNPLYKAFTKDPGMKVDVEIGTHISPSHSVTGIVASFDKQQVTAADVVEKLKQAFDFQESKEVNELIELYDSMSEQNDQISKSDAASIEKTSSLDQADMERFKQSSKDKIIPENSKATETKTQEKQEKVEAKKQNRPRMKAS